MVSSLVIFYNGKICHFDMKYVITNLVSHHELITNSLARQGNSPDELDKNTFAEGFSGRIPTQKFGQMDITMFFDMVKLQI